MPSGPEHIGFVCKAAPMPCSPKGGIEFDQTSECNSYSDLKIMTKVHCYIGRYLERVQREICFCDRWSASRTFFLVHGSHILMKATIRENDPKRQDQHLSIFWKKRWSRKFSAWPASALQLLCKNLRTVDNSAPAEKRVKEIITFTGLPFHWRSNLSIQHLSSRRCLTRKTTCISSAATH
jgi:hypothetical protein